MRALRRGRKKAIAKQKEGYVSSGVALKGSALDVMQDTVKRFEEQEMIQFVDLRDRQIDRAERIGGLEGAKAALESKRNWQLLNLAFQIGEDAAKAAAGAPGG